MLRRFLKEDGGEFGKGSERGAALVTAEFGLGRGLEFHPARVLEVGRMAEMAEEAEPFDISSFDVAGAEVEDGRSSDDLAEFPGEEDRDKLGSAFPVVGRQTEMKIALKVDRSVSLAAGGGEPVAPD